MVEMEAWMTAELVVSAVAEGAATPMAGLSHEMFEKCFQHVFVRSVHEMFAKNAEFGVETSYDPKLRGYTTELKVGVMLKDPL